MAVDAALARLVDQVQTARVANGHFRIVGGGTKDFYGNALQGEPLDVRPLAGISSYEPTELVVTVRAGTPLAELEAALAQKQPAPGVRVAASGRRQHRRRHDRGWPRRACARCRRQRARSPARRDAAQRQGRGPVVRRPGDEERRRLRRLARARRLDGHPRRDLRGVAEGAAAADRHAPRCASRWIRRKPCARSTPGAASRCRCRPAPAGTTCSCCDWPARAPPSTPPRSNSAVSRSSRHSPRPSGKGCATSSDEFFASALKAVEGGAALWRLGVPQTAPPISLPGEQLVEWGGAQRWLCTPASAAQVRDAAAAAGGHATLFRRPRQEPGAFHPLSAPLARFHRELKKAFDPDRVFNRGRLYPGPLSADADQPGPRIQRHPRRRGGRGHPAQVRALRLLYCHLPDLPAARRRARRAARAHLPDQAGARRRGTDTRDAVAPRPLPDLPQLRDAPARAVCSTGTWWTSAARWSRARSSVRCWSA